MYTVTVYLRGRDIETGSRKQARYVLSVAPAALEAARQLISQHELRLHNGPPESVDGAEALEKLRELHRELGILIELAEAGATIDDKIEKLRTLWQHLFTWTKDTGELCIAGAKPVLAAAPLTWGVWALLGAVCEPAIFAAWGLHWQLQFPQDISHWLPCEIAH